MVVSGEQLLQEIDSLRRRAYSATGIVLAVVTGVLSLRDILIRDWMDLPSSVSSCLLSLLILLCLHHWQVPTERLNRWIAALLIPACLLEFIPALQHTQLRVGQYLSFLLVTSLWFGLLPLRPAALLSLGLYLCFSVVALTRAIPDPPNLFYLGGVTVVIGVVASFGQQISRQQREAIQYQQEALTDALTGLPNRRAFQEQLQAFWTAREVSGSNPNASFALLMLDLDHFKMVNDQYSHAVGDQVLQHISPALRPICGPSSTLARWGGEEFMLLLPNCTALQAYGIAAQLDGLTLHLPAGLPSVNFSAGAVLSHEANTMQELLHLADARLHAAKAFGRNQVRWNTHLGPPPTPDTPPPSERPKTPV